MASRAAPLVAKQRGCGAGPGALFWFGGQAAVGSGPFCASRVEEEQRSSGMITFEKGRGMDTTHGKRIWGRHLGCSSGSAGLENERLMMPENRPEKSLGPGKRANRTYSK